MQAESVKITVSAAGISIESSQKIILQTGLAQLSAANIPAENMPEKYLRIGELSPENGGVFAGIMRGENGQPDYYLFVPSNIANSPKLAWGGYGDEIANANHTFDGLANTKALADGKHPAADWAASLNINGFNDYYLPARRELSLCYANVPELFEKEWHWSSTQYSAVNACVQHFSDGHQGGDRKGSDYRVRAVRRKLIIQ